MKPKSCPKWTQDLCGSLHDQDRLVVDQPRPASLAQSLVLSDGIFHECGADLSG